MRYLGAAGNAPIRRTGDLTRCSPSTEERVPYRRDAVTPYGPESASLRGGSESAPYWPRRPAIRASVFEQRSDALIEIPRGGREGPRNVGAGHREPRRSPRPSAGSLGRGVRGPLSAIDLVGVVCARPATANRGRGRPSPRFESWPTSSRLTAAVQRERLSVNVTVNRGSHPRPFARVMRRSRCASAGCIVASVPRFELRGIVCRLAAPSVACAPRVPCSRISRDLGSVI